MYLCMINLYDDIDEYFLNILNQNAGLFYELG